jgi:hypothetical protein
LKVWSTLHFHISSGGAAVAKLQTNSVRMCLIIALSSRIRGSEAQTQVDTIRDFPMRKQLVPVETVSSNLWLKNFVSFKGSKKRIRAPKL